MLKSSLARVKSFLSGHNRLFTAAPVVVAPVVSAPVFAQTVPATTGPDYTALLSSIQFGSTISAVASVAAGLVGVYIVIKGSKIVIAMLRGT